jgi:hypothetical protein
MREDVAESFLPWLALRHRSDRIDAADALAIAAVMPNRLRYFDAHDFDLFPTVASPVPEPSTLLLLGGGIAVLAERARQRSRRGLRIGRGGPTTV